MEFGAAADDGGGADQCAAAAAAAVVRQSLVVVVEIQYFHPLTLVVVMAFHVVMVGLARVEMTFRVGHQVAVEHYLFYIADDDFRSYCQYVNFEEAAEDRPLF